MNNEFDIVVVDEERASTADSLSFDKTIESLKKDSYALRREFSDRTFYCEYCGKIHPIDELHISSESDNSYTVKTGFLGRGIVEQKTKSYITLRCKRCTNIHHIAGLFHILLGIILIGLFCYPTWKRQIYYQHYHFDAYMWPIAAGWFAAYLISRVDWLIIKLIWGVERKPKFHD